MRNILTEITKALKDTPKPFTWEGLMRSVLSETGETIGTESDREQVEALSADHKAYTEFVDKVLARYQFQPDKQHQAVEIQAIVLMDARRIGAEKLRISTEAHAIASRLNPEAVAIFSRYAAEKEAEERSAHERFGIPYAPSELVNRLKKLPAMIPTDIPSDNRQSRRPKDYFPYWDL